MQETLTSDDIFPFRCENENCKREITLPDY